MLLGLIGKANVGKSTFFNSATDLNVQCGNYPFTTISANMGVTYARVECVCREFSVQDSPIHSLCIDGVRFIPIKLMDIAGLIPGASKGKGLGNRFLDDARQADALIHVVDAAASTDAEGRPVTPGTGDPAFDMQFVSTIGELGLSAGNAAEWTEQDLLKFCERLRAKSKPIVIAANKADLPSAKSGLSNIRHTRENAIACSSELELLLRRATRLKMIEYLPGDSSFKVNEAATISTQQRHALHKANTFLAEYGSTGVQKIINKAIFDLLKLIVVYPVEDEIKLTDRRGNVLPDAHLLPASSTPIALAEKIHADLAKGFMYAIDARSKMRLGADYKLKNNDVVKIVSATSSRR